MKRQWKKGILAVLSLVLVISSTPVTSLAAGISDIYGASKLRHNPRYRNYAVEYGIDVSHHQGEIDWKKVKNSGIDFAIIRVAARSISSGGGRIKDRYVKQNLQGATENEIPFGVYVYSQALTVKEAQEEADWVLEEIEGYAPTLPIVFDYEYAHGGRFKSSLSKTKKTNNCLAFCKKTEAAGYTPMLYANKSFLENSIRTEAISQDYPIWLAHYSNSTSYQGDYQYWQYTSSGYVDGIQGKVDMNVRYVDKNLQIKDVSKEKINLTWNEHANAIGYEIYRRENDKEFRLYASVDEKTCTYEDTEVKKDTVYTYKVRPILAEDEYAEYYASVTACSQLVSVPQLKAGEREFDQLTIRWKASDVADGYEIWKYNKNTKKYICKARVTADSYTDINLTASTQYKYRLRLYRDVNGKRQYSPYSKILMVKTSAPVKAKVTAGTLNVRKKADITSKILKKVPKNTVLTLTASAGDWYRTSVTPKGKKRTAYVSKDYVKVVKVGTTKLSPRKATFDTTKLKWTAVSGAAGYQVQRYNKSTKQYETFKEITKKGKVTCIDENRNASTNYQYRVRAWKTAGKKRIYGSWSNVLTAKTQKAVKGNAKVKLQVRKTAKEHSSVLKTVKKGTNLTITGSKGKWYRVSVTWQGKKKTGYVDKKYVRL